MFQKLDEKIRKALKKQGIEKPTLIQERAFDYIYNGFNVLLISPTGTGKTLAALLPIFQKWLGLKPKPVSILYISPMKSLNRDQLEHLIHWGKELSMEVTVRHGDTSAYERKLQTEFPNDMMIVTLETLQPILVGKKIREHLKNVRWVVIDEVHEIYDSKRGVQLALALERLRELAGEFQIVMLSATVGNPESVAAFFSGGRKVNVIKAEVEKPFEIKVVYPKGTNKLKEIAEKIFGSLDAAARLKYVIETIKKHHSVLVFTNTREFAEILTSRIKSIDKKLPVAIHHSSLSKSVRIKAEREFKEGKLKALICTSSLQLGVDIGHVDLVIQYMSPREVTQLVQRVGRSGHGAERISKGIIVSTNEEDALESAVIARKALSGELETPVFHKKPYDVLAHQIVGFSMDFGKIPVEKLYEMIKRAFPYRNLTFKEFVNVLKLMERIGLIFLNGYVKKKRRAFKYYFSQLSTIPDVRQYKVFNLADNTFVGVLDEEFVAVHGETGETFVLKGEPYRIVSVEKDKVLVEPAKDTEAAIPGWEGELIPVPFEVAQEVAKVRGIISAMDKSKAVDWLLKNYPVDETTAESIVSFIFKQKKFGVPTDRQVLIETYEDFSVIHTSFGSKVNETIGRFLAERLSTKGSVSLSTDQYRIILRGNFDPRRIEKELKSIDEDRFRFYTEQALSKSELFSWKFVHVAKRFGVISSDADLGKMTIKRLIDEYRGTPVFEETMKELKTEKLDIEKSIEVIKKIQKGEIEIAFISGLSPLGKLGISRGFIDVIPTEKPKEMFELYKNRLLNTKLKLVCLNCGKWEETFSVSEITNKIKCRKCGARFLAVVNPNDRSALKIARKNAEGKKLTSKEKAHLNKMTETAQLFIDYGRKAAIVLAGRGVGPATARAILSRYHANEDELIRDVMEAERQYFKTRKYWSV